MLMLLNWNKRKFDASIACLFICSLDNIFVYVQAYVHASYEYILKLANSCSLNSFLSLQLVLSLWLLFICIALLLLA